MGFWEQDLWGSSVQVWFLAGFVVLVMLYLLWWAFHSRYSTQCTDAAVSATPEPTSTMPFRVRSWDALQRDIHEWQLNAFPHATLESYVIHAKRELDEVFEHPEDVMEWADVMLLVVGRALYHGHKMSDLFNAAAGKLEVNKSRKWGAPDKHGVSSHVEEAVGDAE